MYTKKSTDFDVIIVGGGHAGIEAAYAAAKMGSSTALITLDIQKIGLMPCNPAIGGVGKGHIVYELSALGGLMPKLCTQTYLQARMLNTRKGPAVQGLRLQIDKYAYNQLSIQMLEHIENLTLMNGMVDTLMLDKTNTIQAIRTSTGKELTASCVVLTTGTFLNGRIHIGLQNMSGGRRDEEAVVNLSLFLQKIGLRMGRLKTGTPPRLHAASINFTALERQEADNLNYLFEFYPHKSINSRDCFITHTNTRTHEIIKNNLHRSGMYNGTIKGIPTRYCPSIEDKIARFPDKTSHHVFVEPEGSSAEEIYPNGISTSLPYDIQHAYVRSIKGFEDAIITKPGYAIEYDFVLPNQLHHTLEVKSIPGLFLAGQINGTTGYEEAAGQGVIAGINAHLKHTHMPPFIIERTHGYIGVMIDDLVSMGVDEPYRMFTSRAERRLILRQDNAFLRLSEHAYKLGLIDTQLYQDYCKERDIIQETLTTLKTTSSAPELLRLYGQSCDLHKIIEQSKQKLSERGARVVQAEIQYGPYLAREVQEVKKQEQYKYLHIPTTFKYTNLPGLSKELQEKLNRHKPTTIAQATLIPGMTPAALALLIVHVRGKIKGSEARIS